MVDNKGIVRSTKEVKDPFVRKSLYILIADFIDRQLYYRKERIDYET